MKWNQNEIDLLAKFNDAEVATKTGRSQESVRNKRRVMGQPSSASRPVVPKTYEADKAEADEKHWKRSYDELNKKYARAVKEATVVEKLVADVKSVAPLSYSPLPAVKVPAPRSGGASQTALLMLSDAHVGKVVNKAQTLGLAEYNFGLFQARLKYLEESIISIRRDHTTTKIDGLVVAMLGDMLDGALSHGVEAGQRNVLFSQWFGASHALAQFLRNLAPHFPTVEVKTVVGNHCVDLDTEILTRRGWKTFDEVTTEDECLGLDPNGKTAHWQPVLEVVVEDQVDRRVCIQNREFDFGGTEHHRFYYWVPGHPMLNEARWSEIAHSGPIQIPAAGYCPGNGEGVPDEMIELVAAVLTDGTINAEGSSVVVYQHPKKEAWVKAAFEKSGLQFSRRERTRSAPKEICGRAWKGGLTSTEVSYRLQSESAREFLRLTGAKKEDLPAWVWNMTHAQFERFIRALILGDGSVHKGERDGSILYGKSESWLGLVQGLCALHGVRASLSSYRPANDNPNLQFRLNLLFGKPRIALGESAKIEYTRALPGDRVWCVKTGTQNWFCRRSGKSYFTGNTRWQSQKRMPTENRFSNLDMFLYALVQALTADIPTIRWELDQQPFKVFNVYDWVFYAAHGDHLRGGDKALGIPNHAFGRQISTTTQLFNKYGKAAPNYYLTGHLHREITLPHATGSVMVNGGFPGLDNYALSENFNPVDPTQRFCFIHPKYGKTAEYSLSLKFATDGRYEIPNQFPVE